ncbi:hypothetical protein NP233_g8384 [Leucocoprinus birnbaumii]|uniref:Uncharacterized protein n=1 Tax=Leucocoprinus birnbaumii TaxID=56174 RepID=A0AAD5YRX7_9AGAR|nr:hypothetical protein NP233_g8384 [Leucocoprinus birnbaumii]
MVPTDTSSYVQRTNGATMTYSGHGPSVQPKSLDPITVANAPTILSSRIVQSTGKRRGRAGLNTRRTLTPEPELPTPTGTHQDTPISGHGEPPRVDANTSDDDNIDPYLRGLRADGTRAHSQNTEDPTVLNEGEQTLPQTLIREFLENDANYTEGEDDEEGEDGDEDEEENGEYNGGRKDSATDPTSEDESNGGDYGIIEGVMRGNHPFKGLKRTTALRPPSQTSSHASKRFQRVIRQILTRVENLSVETGCWIYIAAQHATAVTPFVHYASPRLRAEAGPELDIIHTNFSTMMKTLVMSRRREVMELTLELEQKNEQLEATQRAAVEAQREAQAQREESLRKDAVIAQLMSRIAT